MTRSGRRRVLTDAGQVTIVSATDGNHGRAVARFALDFGQRATVFVPDGVHALAIEAIRAEGADVVYVDGSYDDAVRAAARLGGEDGYVLVQDTAWDEYEDVPGWIVDGYDTLFVEIELAYRGRIGRTRQRGLRTSQSRSRSSGDGQTGSTAMAGLNCGTMSTLAWPAIVAGLDAALVTDDISASGALDVLAEMGVDAGPCGAAPLAAIREVLIGSDAVTFRRHVGIEPTGTVVLLITEGAAANPSRAALDRPKDGFHV